MSREANMEMERSRRQHEYEKKFGKDLPDNRKWDNNKQEWKKDEHAPTKEFNDRLNASFKTSGFGEPKGHVDDANYKSPGKRDASGERIGVPSMKEHQQAHWKEK